MLSYYPHADTICVLGNIPGTGEKIATKQHTIYVYYEKILKWN